MTRGHALSCPPVRHEATQGRDPHHSATQFSDVSALAGLPNLEIIGLD